MAVLDVVPFSDACLCCHEIAAAFNFVQLPHGLFIIVVPTSPLFPLLIFFPYWRTSQIILLL